MCTMPASSGRGAESQPSSSSMSRTSPKSRRACSGRDVNASLRSTLTTGTPRALQDSTKRAPMNPAAPVTRSVSDALTPRSYGISLGNFTSSSYAPAMTISTFVKHHFRHFNAATLVDAAEGWTNLLAGGGKMFLTMAGAMSTAELGLSLAEMIRQGKVHAITCTGANLEEDVFNLVAHDHYVRIPHYRELSPAEETALHGRHLNRVTDTCIPEEEAIRRIEKAVLEEWQAADRAGERRFPHEFLYRILLSGKLKESYQIDPKDSWLLAAAQK